MSNHEFIFDGVDITATIEKNGESFKATVGDKTLELQPVGQNLFSTFVNGERKVIAAARDNKGTTYIDIDSVLIELKEPSEDGFGGGGGDAEGEKDKIYAPMPGKIVKLLVKVGDEVKEKQQMVIVEAMKMENPVLCKADGKVKAINFSDGDQVDTDNPIIELELEEE
jgi:glutaconyl-CoA/methylmalonyl-CoA decarboxylase subunit gamma